jgi:phenylalanyl-tRNA synthetase beta chain
MNEAYLDVLEIPAGDERRMAVSIQNPLRKEDSLLRTMLVPSLIENFIHNFFRGVGDIRIFETARVFRETGEPLPEESVHACGIYYREKAPALWRETADDFFVVKGALESVLEALKITEYSFRPCREPFLHPGKSADLCLSGKRAGFMGELSPAVLERLDIKTGPRVLVFELEMERLMEAAPGTVAFRAIPKFPPVERDMAVVVDEGLKASEIMSLITSYPSEFIEEVSVFDSYRGPTIPAGKKSLAFSIRYRSMERTLTDDEVEDLHRRITAHVTEKTGGELRGE